MELERKKRGLLNYTGKGNARHTPVMEYRNTGGDSRVIWKIRFCAAIDPDVRCANVCSLRLNCSMSDRWWIKKTESSHVGASTYDVEYYKRHWQTDVFGRIVLYRQMSRSHSAFLADYTSVVVARGVKFLLILISACDILCSDGNGCQST